MPVGRSFMFGVHMGAGCGFAPAKYHFVPCFFFFPSPPLSYTSARNMKATQRLDPHLGCTLSFAGLVAAIKLSGNSKKEQGWGGGRGGDQLGLALRKISSATVSLRLLCEGIPRISFLPRSPIPPSSFLPGVPSCISLMLRSGGLAMREVHLEPI